MKFNKINYDHADIIGLIKHNTAALTETSPADLYVDLSIKDRKISVSVFRKDKKELEISYEKNN